MFKKLSNTEKNLNIKKALDFLKKKPKFPISNLFNDYKTLENDSNVIWSLLIEVKNYYSLPKSNILNSIPLLKSSYLKEKSKKLYNYSNTSITKEPSSIQSSKILQSNKIKVCKWLSKLGLSDFFNPKHTYYPQNQLKNIQILAEVLEKLGYPIETSQNSSLKANALSYISTCLNTMKSIPGCKTPSLTPESILSGNEEIIYDLLLNLYAVMPNIKLKPINYYNEYQRQDLTKSLYIWIKGLRVLDKSLNTASDMIAELKKTCVIEAVARIVSQPDLRGGLLETLRANLGFGSLGQEDLHRDDVVLLILENLHRAYDGVSLHIDRSPADYVYIGKGLSNI
jgi:hypothetical protein